MRRTYIWVGAVALLWSAFGHAQDSVVGWFDESFVPKWHLNC